MKSCSIFSSKVTILSESYLQNISRKSTKIALKVDSDKISSRIENQKHSSTQTHRKSSAKKSIQKFIYFNLFYIFSMFIQINNLIARVHMRYNNYVSLERDFLCETFIKVPYKKPLKYITTDFIVGLVFYITDTCSVIHKY